MADVFDLTVRSSGGSYEVRIGRGTYESLLSEREDDFVVADAFFADRLSQHESRLLTVTAIEANKTLSCVEALIENLRNLGARRGDGLVAVGGGIVQDVATGVASLYMRGLQWHYAPTTLLGMADSCIGGKSSLNVGRYKNLAGNFHPPRVVVIDPVFIETLPVEARAGGLCEAMKISYCRGPSSFEKYQECFAAFEVDTAAAPELLHHALTAKTWFIEVDEFDRSERRLLNFGHTFGHALEAASGFALSHGMGVGVGVLCAERLATLLDGEGAAQPALTAHALQLIQQVPGVAERLLNIDLRVFERAFLGDKKHGRDGLHLILPAAGGGVAERVLAADEDTLRQVHTAREEATRMVAA